MPGKTIGRDMNFGFAGSYARHPEMMVATRPNNDDGNIRFGSPLMIDGNGGVVAVDDSFTADKLAGIAGKEIKSGLSYLDQNSGGEYAPKEAVYVFQRGSINVLCKTGDPAVNGDVYVRTVADGDKEVGDFETAEDTGKNILLTNAQWGGSKDPNGIVELVLLTRVNA